VASVGIFGLAIALTARTSELLPLFGFVPWARWGAWLGLVAAVLGLLTVVVALRQQRLPRSRAIGFVLTGLAALGLGLFLLTWDLFWSLTMPMPIAGDLGRTRRASVVYRVHERTRNVLAKGSRPAGLALHSGHAALRLLIWSDQTSFALPGRNGEPTLGIGIALTGPAVREGFSTGTAALARDGRARPRSVRSRPSPRSACRWRARGGDAQGAP
jgi:hypothetical protein